ncbi:MAG: ABC transporter permease [Deltaproteobacteria bacterium]|nr:ABC transporter permease [Deltaproteobacteria bacterium]
MNWRDTALIWRYELRSALRERNIVIYSVVLPVVLYPLTLWLMFTGTSFVAGQTEGFVSRVAILGESGPRSRIERRATLDQRFAVDAGTDLGAALARIRAGTLDAAVELTPPVSPRTNELDYAAVIHFDGSRPRSEEAQRRLGLLLDRECDRALSHEALRRGLTSDAWQGYLVERRNAASGQRMGAFVMSMLLPFMLVVMVAMGCLYPAVDATAGERERGTWETLLAAGTERVNVAVGKYLYVATMGTAAGILNVGAMLVSMRVIFAQQLAASSSDLRFEFPLTAAPVLALLTPLLALLIAAVMMLFASFARTFKEGQSAVMPFYLLLMLPLVVLQQPDLELTLGLALVPVANLLVIEREVLLSRFDIGLIALACAVDLVTVALFLRLAAAVLRYEDVQIGSYRGHLLKLVGERLLGRGARSRGGRP